MAAPVRLNLSRRVEQLARQSATAVRLEDLYRWGQGDASVRLRMARFLHREIAIRNAQLCKELLLLPFGLAGTQGVSDVVSCFSSYVDVLTESPQPKTVEDERRFTELLGTILEDHNNVLATIETSIRELQSAMGAERYEEIRSEVDLFLDRIFMKRIGLRFLLQHHIESAAKCPGVSGIIHSNVDVGPVLRAAACEAQALCRERYGAAPEVVVAGDGAGTGTRVVSGSNLTDANDLTHARPFTYVPLHLHFSCSVLLQNACFAVSQHHASDSSVPMAKVTAVFAHGSESVSVRVSDKGGGIPRSNIHLAWSYFNTPNISVERSGFVHRHNAPLGAGNPNAAGLPLARLHAKYYGGDLVLKSIEGFGTDAYLFLNRLGLNCENLPHGVRVSPAMRDSSVADGASISLSSVGAMNKPEINFLQRRLREFRQRHEAKNARLDSMDS